MGSRSVLEKASGKPGASPIADRAASTVVTVLFVVAALFVFAGCSDGKEQSSSPPGGSNALADPREAEDSGPVHIHGLGIDPADGALVVASHTGLFRLPPGSRDAERVADRHQDTMAFTVVGPNRFLASGHPDQREGLPPFLGLIETKDAGLTWQEVSLMGQVDFHLLAAAGERVYGFGSEWEGEEAVFLASSDGGESWMKREPPGPLVGLALSPEDAKVLAASTPTGLHLSRDGGKNWRSLPGPPGLLTWPAPTQLYRVDARGAVKVSTDEGESWQAVGRLPDAPAAFANADGKLLAATHSGAILESRDGGNSWKARFQPLSG